MFNEPNHYVVGSTYLSSTLGYRVQHRLYIRRRTSNDAQDLTRSRLLFQRLAELAVTILQFLEQPNVFDSDNCLVSESRHEFDLFVSKGPDLLPPHSDDPKGHSLPE